MLSSLLKLHFDKLQSKSQSVAKISWSLDKINITFKVIEKYQYGLQRTVHLKKKKEKEKLSTLPFDGETNTIIVIVSLQLL